MLQRATENTIPLLPGRTDTNSARFARAPAKYAARRRADLASSGTSLATQRTAQTAERTVPTTSSTTSAGATTGRPPVNPGLFTLSIVPDTGLEIPS